MPVKYCKEYEFSCSSTPEIGRPKTKKRHFYNNHHHHYDHDPIILHDTSSKFKNHVNDNDHDGDDIVNCVDSAAEEFIQRFHQDLRMQNFGFYRKKCEV